MTIYPKRSPLTAIRAFCIQCQGEAYQAIIDCADTACPFFPYRRGAALDKGAHRPLPAIRAYCRKHCLPDAADDIRTCGGDTALFGPCPVFPFRLGANPNISEATKQARRERVLKRMEEGTHNLIATRHHAPFDAPESTKSARGEL